MRCYPDEGNNRKPKRNKSPLGPTLPAGNTNWGSGEAILQQGIVEASLQATERPWEVRKAKNPDTKEVNPTRQEGTENPGCREKAMLILKRRIVG